MSNFREYDRSQRFQLPPDLAEWVQDDDLALFIIGAVGHIPLSSFHVSRTGSGKAQYHPRMMLALPVYCYASGIFPSRRIGQATYRHVSVRFITANTHPDHATIAKFRVGNGAAFKAAFAHVLMLASETGLLKAGMVSVDGTKIGANASKIKSLRYDRLTGLRQQPATDIDDLPEKAANADQQNGDDGLSLPKEIIRRQNLKAKPDAAATRPEHKVRTRAQADKTKSGDNGSGNASKGDPVPRNTHRPEQQTNLTDADSSLMHKSARHEYAYNAQAIVDADGSQPVLATQVLSTSNDREGFGQLPDTLCDGAGKPETLPADAGYAGQDLIDALDARKIEALISVARQIEPRVYDFRPPPDDKPGKKPPPKVRTPWRPDMIGKPETEDAKQKYRKRKSTVEPVFGILKSVPGFIRFHLRSAEKVKLEWDPVTLAYNFKRLAKLSKA